MFWPSFFLYLYLETNHYTIIMKKFIISIAILCAGVLASAQAQRSPMADLDYTFTTVKANPITSVKNQANSGTCWAYSTISFFESEAIRLGGIKDPAKYPDFSEFFVVSHSYMDRAVKYVRLDGNLTFSAGSEADDVLHVIEDYGIVPQSEMTGMNYGTALPAQSELDAVLKAYVSAVAKNPNRTLTTAWKRGFQGILDAYLGEYPEKFTVDGVEYDPYTYRDAMKIKGEDYITIGSFSSYPFYSWAPLEVCDNWRWDLLYNVPLDDFMAVLDNALENGYTAAWGADVSHPGFTRNGLGIYIDVAASTTGSDQERWVGKEEGKPAPVKIVEKEVTQESRQKEYDNKTITDDHGMHIFGIAKDQNGKKYYMVKNSWGETGKYNGIWYVTEAFVRAQSMDIMIHKSALTKDLKKKLGVK